MLIRAGSRGGCRDTCEDRLVLVILDRRLESGAMEAVLFDSAVDARVHSKRDDSGNMAGQAPYTSERAPRPPVEHVPNRAGDGHYRQTN
jgi:hypothetical protein